MQLIITGKNFELSEAIKSYAEKKLTNLKKYFDHIIEVDCTMSIEKNPAIEKNQIVEVTIWANGIKLHAKEGSEEMYASIDLLVEKLEKQIKRYKEKLRSRARKAAPIKEVFAEHTIFDVEEEKEEAEHQIVRTRRFTLKPMFSEDAALELEAAGQEFLVFANAQNQKVNVIYKRKDGNYGLIVPEY